MNRIRRWRVLIVDDQPDQGITAPFFAYFYRTSEGTPYREALAGYLPDPYCGENEWEACDDFEARRAAFAATGPIVDVARSMTEAYQILITDQQAFDLVVLDYRLGEGADDPVRLNEIWHSAKEAGSTRAHSPAEMLEKGGLVLQKELRRSRGQNMPYIVLCTQWAETVLDDLLDHEQDYRGLYYRKYRVADKQLLVKTVCPHRDHFFGELMEEILFLYLQSAAVHGVDIARALDQFETQFDERRNDSARLSLMSTPVGGDWLLGTLLPMHAFDLTFQGCDDAQRLLRELRCLVNRVSVPAMLWGLFQESALLVWAHPAGTRFKRPVFGLSLDLIVTPSLLSGAEGVLDDLQARCAALPPEVVREMDAWLCHLMSCDRLVGVGDGDALQARRGSLLAWTRSSGSWPGVQQFLDGLSERPCSSAMSVVSNIRDAFRVEEMPVAILRCLKAKAEEHGLTLKALERSDFFFKDGKIEGKPGCGGRKAMSYVVPSSDWPCLGAIEGLLFVVTGSMKKHAYRNASGMVFYAVRWSSEQRTLKLELEDNGQGLDLEETLPWSGDYPAVCAAAGQWYSLQVLSGGRRRSLPGGDARSDSNAPEVGSRSVIEIFADTK